MSLPENIATCMDYGKLSELNYRQNRKIQQDYLLIQLCKTESGLADIEEILQINSSPPIVVRTVFGNQFNRSIIPWGNYYEKQ